MNEPIRATVRFRYDGKPATAILTDDGWRCDESPSTAGALNLAASPRDRRPAEGDPFARSAELAADMLGGTAEYPPVADRPDRVY